MSEESNYSVTFSGQLVPGEEPDQVKQRLARLFKSSESAIEKLFTGKSVTIKKDITEEKAITYQKALLKAGAIADVETDEELRAEASAWLESVID